MTDDDDLPARLRNPLRGLHEDQFKAADEIERLRAALRYQEHRDGRVGTHTVSTATHGGRRTTNARCDESRC